MSDVADTSRALDIGRVIRELFAVLGRNFTTFLVLALILVGAPVAILGLLQGDVAVRLATGGVFGPNVFWQILGAFVSGLAGLILQATIIYGAVNDLNGRPVSVVDSLRVGLRAFLPLFGLSILLGLAVGVGFLLLVV